MADLVQFGPFTVYKSPAYEEAVRQKQADLAAERETKKMQQDYLRAQLEEIKAKQDYLNSPEGQSALQTEREKAILGVENARLDKVKKELEQLKSSPEYAPVEAARLKTLESTLGQNLATQSELATSAGERIKNLQSASATLPEGVAGPVMQKDMATQMMRPALELEADMRNRIIGTEAAQAATSKQLGELTGTLPIAAEFGGGTVPATSDVASIYKERFKKLAPMMEEGVSYINSLEPGSPKRVVAEELYGKMVGYEKAEAKKAAQNALKIPGLEGMASSEQAAKGLRDKLPDFISAVGGIDELMRIGEESKVNFDRPRLMARADAIRKSLFGQMRIAFGGGGVQTEQDVKRLEQAIPDATAIINYAAQDRLVELKKMIGRRIASDARVAGYGVKSIQSIIDANSDPEDVGSFGVKKKTDFDSEAEARAAGYGNGDIVKVKGQLSKLKPD